MIDINKSRNNFQKFPSIKQKCDNVLKVPKAIVPANRLAQKSTLPPTPAKKTTATTATSIQKTATVASKTNKLVAIKTKTDSNNSSTNPVRAANQHFFLVSAYKDQNFLKEQCELAHAQVTAAATATKQLPTAANAVVSAPARLGDDKQNNNTSNNNISSNYSRINSIRSANAAAAAAAVITNGMRRSAINNMQNASNSTSSNNTTSNPMGTSSAARTVHKIDLSSSNNLKNSSLAKAPRIASVFPATTATVATALSASKSSSSRQQQQQVRPLVHRTIPNTAVIAANAAAVAAQKQQTAVAAATNQNVISYSNKVNNNNNNNNSNNATKLTSLLITMDGTTNLQQQSNNNMQQQHNGKALHEQDDIKFIDSDEISTAQACNERKLPTSLFEQRYGSSSSAAKNRTRPKSICASGQQFVFEKINNSYKYANGVTTANTTTATQAEAGNVSALARRLERSTAGGGTANAGSSTASIDSSSIKASIEKFNNLSEQKRLPLNSVTLRAQTNSGSTSNLQHHRHSTDLDNSNLRLPSGGSLTRQPYRSNATASKVIASIQATPSSAVATSTTATATTVSTAIPAAIGINRSAALTTINSNSLPNKSSLFNRNTERVLNSALSHATATTTAAMLNSNAGCSATMSYKLSHSAGSKTLQESSIIANSLGDIKKLTSEIDDNIRSSANVKLPTSSPTSSRYWDRNTTDLEANKNSNSSSSDEKVEGLCGLRNIGNTCFMNSIIQCLSHTYELTKFLRNQGVGGTVARAASAKDQQILHEYAKLIRDMWTNNTQSVTPMDLKRAFSSKHRMYSDYNQQDAQEFLRFFLDSLHSALNSGIKGEPLKIDDNLSDNKKADLTWEWYTRHDNSLIRDLFVGQLKSTLKCTTCGNTSVTFDPFWDLSVPLPSSSRCKLDACLDLFGREEVLDGDEMPTCSRCQTRRKCTKRFTIQRFPKYLVIHLKRFSETRWSKLSNIVEFPTGERELNMGAYASNPNSNIYYSLYSISNHMGSTAGGHYVALCKHPVSKKWHEFNDNIVSEPLSENHLVSSSAYILFYERA